MRGEFLAKLPQEAGRNCDQIALHLSERMTLRWLVNRVSDAEAINFPRSSARLFYLCR